LSISRNHFDGIQMLVSFLMSCPEIWLQVKIDF